MEVGGFLIHHLVVDQPYANRFLPTVLLSLPIYAGKDIFRIPPLGIILFPPNLARFLKALCVRRGIEHMFFLILLKHLII